MRQLKKQSQKPNIKSKLQLQVFQYMRHLKEKCKPLTLVVLAIVVTYGYSYMDTFSNAYGSFNPTNSNKDLITFNYDRPPLSQDFETTTETNAFLHDVRYLHKDDFTPAGSAIVDDVNNDIVKYFRSKDNHIERCDLDADASNQTSMNHTSDQIEGKYPKMSHANIANATQELTRLSLLSTGGPDLLEKLIQAGDLPQTLAISSTAMISSACGLEEFIKSEGAFQSLLSSAHTTACCNGSACFYFSFDCGKVAIPCDWSKKTEFISGDSLSHDKLCYEQSMPMCAYHFQSTTVFPSDKLPTVDPVCDKSCPSNTSTDQESDKVQVMSSYRVGPFFDEIKKEIFTYGSVAAAYTVQEDFFTYISVFYQQLTGLWINIWGDQGIFKIWKGCCGINDQMHSGNYRITTRSTATLNVKKKYPKVRSDSNNLKTLDQTDSDFEILPTSTKLALASTQANEDTARPDSKTTACDPADQICFNSQLVTAYLADQKKCPILDTNCFKKNLASTRLACQGDSASEQALAASAQKIPNINLKLKKNLDRVTEPVAKRTNYDHCKCYKAAVEDALTKLNESRPFKNEVGFLIESLDNNLLSSQCGIYDWNQLCGMIVCKKSPEDGSIQLDFEELYWQGHASTHLRGRRLQVAVDSGQCAGPTANYNLLNTDVQASQSYGSSGSNTNARVGCDGVIQRFNPFSSYTKIVNVQASPNGEWQWVATFQQTTNVQSILFIEDFQTSRISFLVGDSPTFQNNPSCIGGQLIAGGWLDCSRTGKYLVLTGTNGFSFMEVMCYSQYYVHHNALSSTLSSTLDTAANYLCTISTNCKASNVIQTTLVIWNNYPSPTTSPPCCIYSQSQTDPTLQVTIPAHLMIDLVIITPSDQQIHGSNAANPVITDWQNNIEVLIVNSAGEKQICGTLSDYNLYTEVPCKKVGNQIIVTRPGSSMTLAMAGVSILSNCECSYSSLNPALIFRAASPLASPSTISTTSTGAPISIKLNKQMSDTVSSVCGNADGFTKCGLRTLVFTDKMTGFQITFPYKGFELNSDQSELTLSPAKAPRISVLTLTVKLDNYPKVTFLQDIMAIVEGAIGVVQPLRIPTMALNATINQEAFLDLPKLDVSNIYFVVNKQKFEASVDGNQLKVLSNNETDVGTYNLDLVALFSSKKVSFEVKVILSLPTSIDTKTQTNEIQKEGNIPSTTSETIGDSVGSTTISDQETETLLETAACIMGKANDISCVGPDGFSFFYSKKKAQLAPHKLPKFSVSKVNTKGQFYFEFSEPVGLEALNIPASQSRKLLEGWAPQGRRLRTKGGARSSSKPGSARSSSNSGSESNQTSLNLLSAKHLRLTIKSENTTAPVFSWRTTNITSTLIKIQLEFQDPLYISISPGVLDKLQIQILPPALIYMRSLATGEMTEDALRAVSKELPPQVILGATIEAAEEASVILKDSSLSNIIVQIVLSQSMGQMWSMVNAQQIIMSYQLLNLQQPGNVILVSTELSNISSFTLFPVDDFFAWLFYFTPTDPPGVGFECMGVENASVTLFQGMTFLIMILIGLQYLVFGLAYGCRLYDRLMSKIEQKLRPGLCFGLFYLFLQETYLDWAIGSALRLEQPKFQTPSDYFDFGLGCAGILITVVFPCYCFFFLKRNVNKLDDEDFKSKHGALYDGFTTNNAERRSASMYMAVWFLLRRFFTAVNLVLLRDQTIWIQLTLNMWLSLIDVCVKIHLSPYESKLGGFMEKFNDLFVLTCAYFPYLFTGLIPSPEDQYFIGWVYNGTVGAMVAANVFIMLKTAYNGIVNKIKEIILKYQLKNAMEARNAEKQEKMKKLLQSGNVESAIAVKFKNGLRAIHLVSLDQFIEIKREERQLKKDASLAQRLTREMDDELSEIAEVDEESQQSSRAVRNDIEAQICKESQMQYQPQPQVAKKSISPKKKVPSFNKVQEPNRKIISEKGSKQTENEPVRIRKALRMVEECKVQIDAIGKQIIKEERKQLVFNEMQRQRNEKLLHK